MISSATVQSAIVLMNRRMKVERGPATAGFVPVCSSVEDMHLHHLGGTRAAQEGSARFEETARTHLPVSSTVAGYTTGLARLKLRARVSGSFRISLLQRQCPPWDELVPWRVGCNFLDAEVAQLPEHFKRKIIPDHGRYSKVKPDVVFEVAFQFQSTRAR